jgi:hypothetical protein
LRFIDSSCLAIYRHIEPALMGWGYWTKVLVDLGGHGAPHVLQRSGLNFDPSCGATAPVSRRSARERRA